MTLYFEMHTKFIIFVCLVGTNNKYMRINKSSLKKLISIILLKATLLTSVSTISAGDTENKSKKTDNVKSEVTFGEEYPNVQEIILCTLVAAACIISFSYRGKCTSSSFSLNNAACQEEKLTSITQTAPNVSNELSINNSRLNRDALKPSSEVIEEIFTTPNNAACQEEKLTSIIQTAPNVSNELSINNSRLNRDALSLNNNPTMYETKSGSGEFPNNAVAKGKKAEAKAFKGKKFKGKKFKGKKAEAKALLPKKIEFATLAQPNNVITTESDTFNTLQKVEETDDRSEVTGEIIDPSSNATTESDTLSKTQPIQITEADERSQAKVEIIDPNSNATSDSDDDSDDDVLESNNANNQSVIIET